MVSMSLQLKAEFLLEQVDAIESCNSEMKRAKRDPTLSKKLMLVNTTDDTITSREIGEAEGHAEHEQSSAGQRREVSLSSVPLTMSPFVAVGHMDKPSRSITTDERVPKRIIQSMQQTISNARLKQRRLESEIVYLKKALSEFEAEKTSLQIRVIHLEKQITSEASQVPGKLPNERKEDDLKLERHLNSLLVGRNQAMKENYTLKAKLLDTCEACYDRLRMKQFDESGKGEKPYPQACSPTWRHVAQQVVREMSEATGQQNTKLDLNHCPHASSENSKKLIETARATLDKHSDDMKQKKVTCDSPVESQKDGTTVLNDVAKDNLVQEENKMKTSGVSRIEKSSTQEEVEPNQQNPTELFYVTKYVVASKIASSTANVSTFAAKRPFENSSSSTKSPSSSYSSGQSEGSFSSGSNGALASRQMHKKAKQSIEKQANLLMNIQQKRDRNQEEKKSRQDRTQPSKDKRRSKPQNITSQFVLTRHSN